MLDLFLDTIPLLPPHQSSFGGVQLEWIEIEPGLAQIDTKHPSIEARHLAYTLLASDLQDCGYEIDALIIPDFNTRVATWAQVMEKAIRLYRNGNVTLLRNGYNSVVARVIGDHGAYTVEMSRDDPNSRVITQATCTCPWWQYNQQTQPKRHKFEDRVCAHVLAAYYASRSTALDEDIHPATQFGQQPQQMMPGMPQSPPGTATYPEQYAPTDDFRTLHQNDPWAQAGPLPSQPSQGPPFISPQPTLIPMQADDIAQQQQEWNEMWKEYVQNQAVSVPKQQGPYPGDPTSTPGTLSHVIKMADSPFMQGDTVRINVPTMAQKEGVEGSIDQGQWVDIPRNSQGEVFDVDQTTGYVVVIFPMKDPGFPRTVPYPVTAQHARAYIESDLLTLINRGGMSSPLRANP